MMILMSILFRSSIAVCLISIVVALCQQSTPCESFLLGRTLSFRVLARRSIKATKPWNKHYHDVAVSFSKTTTDPSTPEGELDTSGIKTTKKEQENEKNPLALASWYAVEAFGKLFAPDSSKLSTTDQGPTINLTAPPSSLNETLARIELDFERSYFLSGAVDRLIYDPDCVFSDPFVSFRGRDRFVENLSNLGSFITKYSAKRLQYAVVPDTSTVKTKVMVKLELNLPWKPVLAWPWGVEYQIDPNTYLIVEHRELWDIEPWEGVKQIFRRPTVQV